MKIEFFWTLFIFFKKAIKVTHEWKLKHTMHWLQCILIELQKFAINWKLLYVANKKLFFCSTYKTCKCNFHCCTNIAVLFIFRHNCKCIAFCLCLCCELKIVVLEGVWIDVWLWSFYTRHPAWSSSIFTGWMSTRSHNDYLNLISVCCVIKLLSSHLCNVFLTKKSTLRSSLRSRGALEQFAANHCLTIEGVLDHWTL